MGNISDVYCFNGTDLRVSMAIIGRCSQQTYAIFMGIPWAWDTGVLDIGLWSLNSAGLLGRFDLVAMKTPGEKGQFVEPLVLTSLNLETFVCKARHACWLVMSFHVASYPVVLLLHLCQWSFKTGTVGSYEACRLHVASLLLIVLLAGTMYDPQ